MAITTIYTYPLTGSQREFTVPFEYLARRFVVLTLIGQDRKELVLATDFRFISKTIVQTTVAWGPADGYERIDIRRDTSATDRLVDFADGSILRASELNISQIQTLHVAEEARNMVADTIAENADGDLDARGRRLVNLADAQEPDHAVTLRQEQAWSQSTLGNRNAAEAAAVLSVSARDAAQSAQGVSTAQATLATAKATESEASAVRSETAAGTIGNNVALSQQAAQAAQAARDTTLTAAASVQGANIPSAIGNGLKWLRQKADELGFEYVEAYTKQAVDSLISGLQSAHNELVTRVSSLEGAPILKVFKTGQMQVTAGSTQTSGAHGLSSVHWLSVKLTCLTADLGYPAGKRIFIGPCQFHSADSYGFLLTELDNGTLEFKISAKGLYLHTTGGLGGPTPIVAASWRAELYAYGR